MRVLRMLCINTIHAAFIILVCTVAKQVIHFFFFNFSLMDFGDATGAGFCCMAMARLFFTFTAALRQRCAYTYIVN